MRLYEILKLIRYYFAFANDDKMSILTTIFHDVWFECVIIYIYINTYWSVVCIIDITSLLSLLVFVSVLICLFSFKYPISLRSAHKQVYEQNMHIIRPIGGNVKR